jgi:phosphatidate cytidylyltransferase
MQASDSKDMTTDSQSRSAWKDAPRRFLTVGIGVPSIVLLLRHYVTSWLFFQGAHLICLIEWKNLVPSPDQDSKKNDAADCKRSTSQKAAFPTKSTLQQLLSMFDDQWLSLTKLEKCEFYAFACFSLATTILPTSLIPLELMFAGISLRLIPHFRTLQTTQSPCSREIHTIQHYQFGLAYISIGFHFLLQICRQGGPINIGCLLFVVWMSDTGALILGRLMRKKAVSCKENTGKDMQQNPFLSFLKSVSPGKTLPGLFGAIITGPISAILYPIDLQPSATNPGLLSFGLSHDSDTIFQKAILGILLSVSGIVGDLAESSVKRMSGKKDSGGLLPGHGGVVDRFDSVFTAGIVYYYWVLA